MRRPSLLIAAIPILWLGFALRLHELDAVPLRGDEAFSAFYWADLPLSHSLTALAKNEPHPPLAFVIFRAWRHFIGGIDEPFALRMLPALGNVIGIPALLALALRLRASPMTALCAALLMAAHPYVIWHSQDFRNYALWSSASATALWLGLRLLHRPTNLNRALYLLAGLVSALLFYAEAFVMLALGLYGLYRHRLTGPTRALLSLQSVIILAAAASFALTHGPYILSGGYPGNTESLNLADYLTRFLPTLTFGPFLPHIWPVIVLALAALTLALLTRWRPQYAFIFAVALVPLLLIGLVSARINVFNPRYVLAAAPGFILLIVFGASTLRTRLGLALMLLWLILSAASLHSCFNDAAFRKSPAWDELGAFLDRNVSADDLVIQLSADLAFTYYYRGPADERALPTGPLQSAADIHAELAELSAAYESVYVVAHSNPRWPNANAVLTWMDANMQQVLVSDASGLAIRQYKHWRIEDNPASSLARFGDTVELQSYRFFREPLPTGELLLWINWRPVARSNKPLKSFAHLYADADEAPILLSQDDKYPQAGRMDSASWPLGAAYRDVYYLPTAAMTPGPYRLTVGWYEPESQIRLITDSGLDSFALETFDYPPPP